MKIKSIIVKNSLLCSSLALAFSAQSNELNEFFQRAIDTDPSIRLAHQRNMADEAQVKERQAAYLPQVVLRFDRARTRKDVLFATQQAVDGNKSKYQTDASSLQLTQRIFDVGAIAGVRSAAADQERSAFEVDVAAQNRWVELLKTYLSGSEALERFAVTQSKTRFLEARAQRERAEVANGRMRPGELAATEADLAQSLVEFKTAQSDYQRAQDDLCRFVDQVDCPAIKAFGFNGEMTEPEFVMDSETSTYLAVSPDQLALDAGVKRQRFEVELMNAGHYPRVNFEIERRRDDNGGSIFDGASLVESTIAHIKVEWDLFNSGATRAAERRAMAIEEGLRQSKEMELRDAIKRMRAAERLMRTSIQSDSALLASVKARDEVVALLARQVEAGTEIPERLFEAHYESTQAIAARQAAHRLYFSARVDYDRLLGKVGPSTVDALSIAASDDALVEQASAYMK